VFTARYDLSPYIAQVGFVLKGLTHNMRWKFWKAFFGRTTGTNHSTVSKNSFCKSLQYFSYLYQRPSGVRQDKAVGILTLWRRNYFFFKF